jgi:hypothetical protein
MTPDQAQVLWHSVRVRPSSPDVLKIVGDELSDVVHLLQKELHATERERDRLDDFVRSDSEPECSCYESHGGHMPGCPHAPWAKLKRERDEAIVEVEALREAYVDGKLVADRDHLLEREKELEAELVVKARVISEADDALRSILDKSDTTLTLLQLIGHLEQDLNCEHTRAVEAEQQRNELRGQVTDLKAALTEALRPSPVMQRIEALAVKVLEHELELEEIEDIDSPASADAKQGGKSCADTGDSAGKAAESNRSGPDGRELSGSGPRIGISEKHLNELRAKCFEEAAEIVSDIGTGYGEKTLALTKALERRAAEIRKGGAS